MKFNTNIISICILILVIGCSQKSDISLGFEIDSTEDVWKEVLDKNLNNGNLVLSYNGDRFDGTKYNQYETLLQYGKSDSDTITSSFVINWNSFQEGRLIEFSHNFRSKTYQIQPIFDWILQNSNLTKISYDTSYSRYNVLGENMTSFVEIQMDIPDYNPSLNDTVSQFLIEYKSKNYNKYFDEVRLGREKSVTPNNLIEFSFLGKPKIEFLPNKYPQYKLTQGIDERTNIHRSKRHFPEKDIIGVKFDLIYKSEFGDYLGKYPDMELMFDVPKYTTRSKSKNKRYGQPFIWNYTLMFSKENEIFRLVGKDNLKVDYTIKKVLFDDKSIFPDDY